MLVSQSTCSQERSSTVLGNIWLACVGVFFTRSLQQQEVLATTRGRAVGDLGKLGCERRVIEVGLGEQTCTLHVVIITHGGNKVPDISPADVNAVGKVFGVGFETGVNTGQGSNGGLAGWSRDSGVWGGEGGTEERKRHGGVEDDVGNHCA